MHLFLARSFCVKPYSAPEGIYGGADEKRYPFDDEDPQEVDNDVQQRCRNYALMLRSLMDMIQDYLLLSDDNTQRGALNSLHLVGSTAQLHEDNRICIWLEDVWSER